MSVGTRKASLKKNGSLADKNPLLAKELHKDNKLNADEIPITYGRQESFKWKCHKCGYIRYAAVNVRHLGFNKITGCPNKKCENYRWKYLGKRNINLQITKRGSFAKNYPELLAEWDFEKNKRTPDEYSPDSAQKIWWICKNKHSWEASIGSRSRGSGCKKCSGHGTSKLEIRVYCELIHIFRDVDFHKYIKGLEIDIYLNNYNLGIETDGYIHHKLKTSKFDLIKNKKLKQNNVKLIRLRDHRLLKISRNDVLIGGNSSVQLADIKNLLRSIQKIIKLNNIDGKSVKKYLTRKNFASEKHYNKLISDLPSPIYKLSLEFLYPDLSKQWCHVKNYPLKPSMFTPGSNKKIWWKCIKGHDDWEAEISRRAIRNDDCYFCGLEKISIKIHQNKMKKNGSLQDKHPELVEFFLEKENSITVDNVHCGSGPNYWWYCKKHRYKWQSRVDKIRQRRHPCRKCSDENRVKRKLRVSYE